MNNMEITLQATAHEMIESLKYEAKQHGVSDDDIRKLFANHDINSLDDLFNDGGEVRCEQFGDLAFEYALQFGEFDSIEFHNARWDAMKLAMDEY